MWLKILIVASLSTGYLFLDISKEDGPCEKYKNLFIESNNNFVGCVINNNNNGCFCSECTKHYSDALVNFNALLSESETDNNTTVPCHSLFIDNNQLGLVEGIFASSRRIWNTGYCSGELTI